MAVDRRLKRRAETAASRAKREARAAAIAAEAAIRAEEEAEEQAPRAQRQASDLRDALAVPDDKRGGYVRGNSLWQMHRQGTLTRDQFGSARRYALDYEIGVLGANPADRLGMYVDGATRADMPQTQIDALGRYREASDAMGVLRQVVQWIAIHDRADNRWTLGRAAQVLGVPAHRASELFKAGLDLLTLHYKPDRPAPVVAVAPEPPDGDAPEYRFGRHAAAAKAA